MCTVWAVLFGVIAIAFWKGKTFRVDEADVLSLTCKGPYQNLKLWFHP
jgi:cbb3-type cytochrome oxidase subunit 3